MPLDIREIDPCSSCVRQRFPFDFGDNASPDAGAYLLVNAIEKADCEATIDPDDDQARSNFLANSYGMDIKNGAKGAVLHCGRSIGRNACLGWQLNQKMQTIEPLS